MSVAYAEFLVEEPSMEALLRVVLPQILGQSPFEIRVFQGKANLLAQLPHRLRGYAWFPDTYRIVVVVDRDDDDCHVLKQQLEQHAQSAGRFTRAQRDRGPFTVINRIAIEELEAWYFGDWQAVRAAYPNVAANVPRRAAFRDPDAIAGGAWEAFERVLQRAGYFKGGLRKLEAAQTIAPHLVPARNTSRSFQVFRDAVLELAAPG